MRRDSQIESGAAPVESKRKAFLDHFLSSEGAHVLSQRDIIEELKTLSAGAVGTTMDLMSFFLLALSINPDVQDSIAKVRTRLRTPRLEGRTERPS